MHDPIKLLKPSTITKGSLSSYSTARVLQGGKTETFLSVDTFIFYFAHSALSQDCTCASPVAVDSHESPLHIH